MRGTGCAYPQGYAWRNRAAAVERGTTYARYFGSTRRLLVDWSGAAESDVGVVHPDLDRVRPVALGACEPRRIKDQSPALEAHDLDVRGWQAERAVLAQQHVPERDVVQLQVDRVVGVAVRVGLADLQVRPRGSHGLAAIPRLHRTRDRSRLGGRDTSRFELGEVAVACKCVAHEADRILLGRSVHADCGVLVK